MELYTTAPRLAALEAELAPSDGWPRLQALVELAWHLRQRNSPRALALADEAALLLGRRPTAPPEQALAFRLALTRSVARRTAWPTLVGTSGTQLGGFLRAQGRLDEARWVLVSAMAALQAVPSGISRANACVEMGVVLREGEALIEQHAMSVLHISVSQALATIHRRHCLPAPAGASAPTPAAHYAERALEQGRHVADWKPPAAMVADLAQDWAAAGQPQPAQAVDPHHAVEDAQPEGSGAADGDAAVAAHRRDGVAQRVGHIARDDVDAGVGRAAVGVVAEDAQVGVHRDRGRGVPAQRLRVAGLVVGVEDAGGLHRQADAEQRCGQQQT